MNDELQRVDDGIVHYSTLLRASSAAISFAIGTAADTPDRFSLVARFSWAYALGLRSVIVVIRRWLPMGVINYDAGDFSPH